MRLNPLHRLLLQLVLPNKTRRRSRTRSARIFPRPPLRPRGTAFWITVAACVALLLAHYWETTPHSAGRSANVQITDAPSYSLTARSGTVPPDAVPARVVNVTDGDSVVVRFDQAPPIDNPGGSGATSPNRLSEARRRQVRLRLDSIDAPETAQSHGIIARDILASEISGKVIHVRIAEKDQYGRQVATIFLPDGTNLNREMVARGLAWHYQQHSRDPAMEGLEREARAARRGLWAEPNPVPPWEFRARQRGRPR